MSTMKGKVSAPTVSRDDQVAFAKVEKLRGIDLDDIRRALQLVCGNEALDKKAISSIKASLDALDTADQISYVKIETLRKTNPIMDVHRAVQKVCGNRTFSSSTFARWSKSFKQGKPVRLGYEKIEKMGGDARTVQLMKKIIHGKATSEMEEEDTSETEEEGTSETEEEGTSEMEEKDTSEEDGEVPSEETEQ